MYIVRKIMFSLQMLFSHLKDLNTFELNVTSNGLKCISSRRWSVICKLLQTTAFVISCDQQL